MSKKLEKIEDNLHESKKNNIQNNNILISSKKSSKKIIKPQNTNDVVINSNNKSKKLSKKLSRNLSKKSSKKFKNYKININNLSFVDKIKQYIKNVLIINYNPQKVSDVLENIKTLKIKSGSGAIFGIYKNDYIVKIYNYKDTKIVIKKNCFYLKRIMNEIIINLAISQPFLFNSAINKEYFANEIKPYTNYLVDIASNQNQVYLLTNFLQVEDKFKNKKYSDLFSIISNNHIQNINIFIKEEKYSKEKIKEILEQYDIFLIEEVIKPFIKVIRYYQNNLGFIHSDLKINNIFIKEKEHSSDNSGNNNKYDLLEKGKIITNFIPILADFDNSSINLGKLKILPQRYLVNKIARFIPNIAGIVDDVRYNCEINFGISVCPKFKLYNFDLLSMMINLLFELYKIKFTEKQENELNLRNNIKMYFPKFISFYMQELELTQDIFDEIMKQSYINKGTNFYNINNTIRHVCSYKNKKK